MMKTRFTILGAGSWGTAIAILLQQQNPDCEVQLWCAHPEKAEEMRQTRTNPVYLPGAIFPEPLIITADATEAVQQTDLIVVAIPTLYLRDAISKLTPFWHANIPVLSLAKGIEQETFLRPTEILANLTGCSQLAVLSGPSHAEEVQQQLPASVVVASKNGGLAVWIQKYFMTERFRVYTEEDLIGVELAGALKNVIGIAAGICDGLQLGDNAKAALLTRGLAEMTRFGVANGADLRTFYGLAGMGDLITTCTSNHGRNRAVGMRLARGESLTEILQSMQMVAEGIGTTRGVVGMAEKLNVEMPIANAVYEVLYRGVRPWDAVKELMTRSPKSEKSGL